MEKPILTVAIPTYNRPEDVLATIKTLIPQLRPNVTVLVLDNHSEVDIRLHLQNQIYGFELLPITVIRNKVNIGCDANFVRCFENCEAEYIWTLGDDDLVMDDAIEVILNEITKYQMMDIIGFNFNSKCNLVERNEPIIISDIHELANKLDFFGNWLFISTAVYKTTAYLQHIRFAIWAAYTMASQIVPAMVAISYGKIFILSEKTIVENKPIKDLDKTWSGMQLSMVITILLEAPVKFNNDYLAFGKKLAVQQIGTVSAPVYATLKSLNNDITMIDDYHIYIFKQHFYRTIEFRNNKLKAFCAFIFWLSVLKNKWLLKLLLNNFSDRFATRTRQFGNFNLLMR